MAIDRRFLYAGLFLVAIGGVLVTADLVTVDRGVLLQALQLWPLALIALGAGIVLRRSSLSLPAGVLAAVAPGLLIGGGFALGPTSAGECGTAEVPTPSLVREGSASHLATVSLETGCGTSTIATVPGQTWRVSAGRTDGQPPQLGATQDGLSIDSPGSRGRHLMLGSGREAWDVVLPTSPMERLTVTANANRMEMRLPGADIGSLSIEANGSDVRIDATGAVIDGLDGEVSFGTLSVNLPATTLGGHLEVGVGELRLCKPIGAGMTVTFAGDGLHDVTVGGLDWNATTWRSPDDVLSSNQIELLVDAEFGSVEINPIGGCS